MIEIGNQSGVAGYTAAVFGNDFGPTAGTLTVLGSAATITTWENGYVEFVIPAAAPATGELVLTTSDNQTVNHPFTVYTIDPNFEQGSEPFTNIAFNKFAHLYGLESEFCFAQPSNEALEAKYFLTNFVCGFENVNNVGDAKFGADSSIGTSAIIAIDLETDLTGELWFQFFSDSNWYPIDSPYTSIPANYQIQVSADSSNGQDGNWSTAATISDNDRSARLHRMVIPSGNYRWIRMLVTDGAWNTTDAAGNDFKLREIRVYRPNSGATSRPDTFALYGDSLTAGAFDAINLSGFSHAVKTKRGNSNDLIMATFGLSGQNASGLLNGDGQVDLYDAFAMDDMQNNITYWGIGLGTNDSGDGASGLDFDSSNVSQYDERLESAVSALIANGRIPLVARFPDTDESRGGFGDIESKRKVLADIDRIAARYRLIPGPDLYTPFRRNIETENGNWLGNDGTHHTPAGEVQLIDLWAQAFVDGTPAGQVFSPTPTPATPFPTLDPAKTVYSYLPITVN